MFSNRRESHIKKTYPDIYTEIIKYNQNFGNILWIQKLYNYEQKITETPKCLVCNNNVSFSGEYSKGYYKYCSTKCVMNDNNTKEKIEKTNISKYGHKSSNLSKIIKEKKRLTFQLRYGVDYYSKSTEFNKKTKKTCLLKYGVDHHQKSSVIRDKYKKTCLLKYGVDHYSKTDEYKNKEKKLLKLKKNYSKVLNIRENDIIQNNENLIINNYCLKHSTFIINKDVLYNRIKNKNTICIECNPVNNFISDRENQIVLFLNNLNIIVEKIKINNQEIDIYVPSHKLGIEFDGLYWHSNKFKNINYHLNKTEECKKQNIQLLHIFEDEWVNKQEIVKSIIKSKLGIIENKIFARKCQIKEIDINACKNFLKNNHIQGNVGTGIRIGLFYNNEFVSIMTFGKKRISMGNKISAEGEYEMLRFCNKLNTQVIGGASKMLNYFIKTHQPKSILTFADRRYSNGNLYKQLGFNFVYNTKPNYYYFHNNFLIRHHRFKFRKDALIKEGYNPDKTEHQIMAERGYLRIYDCGHMKFVLNLANT